ncbi:hypothetical protein JQ616_09515 [Bradyrhizobium tropiciagri]|uniref:hypothetical protein n=1 Tax=Bradyrhizobium tropiciagri TaxID=312253 RepID=UPI001BA7C7E6|nr:hypothetical protein [Bradyrhizobium tropiciagri]MBR0895182.1 hypothetical protein [Bradyrhizobium tropiciagri]
MKRKTHLQAPDAEYQCTSHTGGHEGPIALLHLVQQGQPNAASTAARFNDMTARQDLRILERSGALVDSHRPHRQRSRGGDDHSMHPATLRMLRSAPATILPNFH